MSTCTFRLTGCLLLLLLLLVVVIVTDVDGEDVAEVLAVDDEGVDAAAL